MIAQHERADPSRDTWGDWAYKWEFGVFEPEIDQLHRDPLEDYLSKVADGKISSSGGSSSSSSSGKPASRSKTPPNTSRPTDSSGEAMFEGRDGINDDMAVPSRTFGT